MRMLIPRPAHITADELPEAYDAATDHEWYVRVNFVATVDGSVIGSDGRSGSINNEVDGLVFQLLRAWADVVVVGSGTAVAEGYDAPEVEARWAALRAGRAAQPAMAVLSRGGDLPASVDTKGRDDVFALDSSGDDGVTRCFSQLRERGYHRVLLEGGPTIAGLALAAGLVDELCHTTSPRLVGGSEHRMVKGPTFDTPAHLIGLLEADSTLLARWALR